MRDPKLSERMGRTSDRLIRSVKPIYVSDGDGIKHCASGTLIRVGIKNYVITADHVLRSLEKAGREPMFLLKDSRGPGCYSIKHYAIRGDGEKGVWKGGIDIAIMGVPPYEGELLGFEDAFPLEDISPDHSVNGKGEYVCVGCPGAEQRIYQDTKQVHQNYQTLFTYASGAEIYRKLGIDYRTHLVFDYPRMVVGRRSTAPSKSANPLGMSGGGVFWVPRLSELNAPLGSPLLIGINSRLREVNGDLYIETVRISTALRVLKKFSAFFRKYTIRE